MSAARHMAIIAGMLILAPAWGRAEEPRTDPLSAPALRADARLADVTFVDPRHGWAVGDRGTIWATEDGGQRWTLQPSGVACPLSAVSFVDDQCGWVVGGFTHPYAHTSAGVVLSTRDGGKTWNRHPGLSLPALRQARLLDGRSGWAVGGASDLFPSGVFVTQNGGLDWQPVPGTRSQGWQAAGFLDLRTAALAGRRGELATLRGGQIEPLEMPLFGLRTPRRMTLLPPLYGWLVGDGGLVMLTADLGRAWRPPQGSLPAGMADHFDFAALAVRGPKCWIAGTPGTTVFHTADAGRTWSAQPTGQTLPLDGLCFADDQHGWAVGALGTILATADGGRTWRRQRGGGTRAAMLLVAADAEDVPLETVAQLAGEEGYLAVLELLARRDLETAPRGDVEIADRVHEAVVGVGGADARTAWRFPLRQRGLAQSAEQIRGGWDEANDGHGLEKLEAHLVARLRMWQPEIVIVCDRDKPGEALAPLVQQAVVRAAAAAADPTWLPEQFTHAGLRPWQAKKVYATLPPGTSGTPEIVSAQLAPRLGQPLSEVAALPRGLVSAEFSLAPLAQAYRLLIDHLPAGQGEKDFFSGIPLAPGGEARRALPELPTDRLELLQAMARKQRNVQAVLEKARDEPGGGVHLAAQLDDLTGGLEPGAAAGVLYHLADRYRRAGQWTEAAEIYGRLVTRHPEHPLVRPALKWLVQFYASSEAGWRQQGSQRAASGVVQASALSIDLAQQENRPERAALIGQQLLQTHPQLHADASLQFPLAVAQRERGYSGDAQKFLLVCSRGGVADAWRNCALGELWLANPHAEPPKSVLPCPQASAKPRLDGRLDDEIWQRAAAAELRSIRNDDLNWPARVMLARDNEYLYIAVRCGKATGVAYAADDRPRPRDGDLAAHDRVEIHLDLDRDFVTSYRLAIDDRGWTGESCWGDTTWDPQWFVAAHSNEREWSAEAAIGLDQLTGRYPQSRDAWALGLQRVVPGVGFQSWTQPAAIEVIPEGFGYLLFE